MKLSSTKNKLSILLITILSNLVSYNAFADPRLKKVTDQIAWTTGKRSGCVDYFYRTDSRYNECIAALLRITPILQELKKNKVESFNFFKEIMIYPEGTGKHLPNFRDTDVEGTVSFESTDSAAVMKDWLLSLMNDYRPLGKKYNQYGITKKGISYLYVMVRCSDISFSDCHWGLNTLALALKDQELRHRIGEVADTIYVTDQYRDPYRGDTTIYVRYKRKVQAMRLELQKGIDNMN